MQFTTLFTTLFLAASASAGVITDRSLQYCGSQPYYTDKACPLHLPSLCPTNKRQYTCYPQNNNLLCPITDGIIYQPCGQACYDPANYGCSYGQLVPVGKCNGQVYDKNSVRERMRERGRESG
jgi:hypothetical protein